MPVLQWCSFFITLRPCTTLSFIAIRTPRSPADLSVAKTTALYRFKDHQRPKLLKDALHQPKQLAFYICVVKSRKMPFLRSISTMSDYKTICFITILVNFFASSASWSFISCEPIFTSAHHLNWQFFGFWHCIN